MVSDAIQITVNGLSVGLQYALLLLGILLIYQGSKVVNFAQGQIGMVGGLFSYFCISHYGVATPVAAIIAVLVAALLAAALGRTFGATLIRLAPSGGDMILTLAMFLVIDGIAQVLVDGRGRRYPKLVDGSVDVFGAYLAGDTLLSLAIVLILFAVLVVVVRSTTAGIVLRATSEDTDMVELHGWNASRVRVATWALSGALAGVASILIAVRVPVQPDYMVAPLIAAFIAGIVGGFDRIAAPISVAVIIGLVQNWGGAIFGAEYRTPLVFAFAIVALLVVPRRWLSGKKEARA